MLRGRRVVVVVVRLLRLVVTEKSESCKECCLFWVCIRYMGLINGNDS